MHYYPFHISDYMAHTAHLDLLEDLAYRRMIDWQHLHEKPLPNDIEEIAKLIGMRSHCDSIAYVLREFFELGSDGSNGYKNKRVWSEIERFRNKSKKAQQSAKCRWDKEKNAVALQSQSEGNANQQPITNNQDNNMSTDKPADDLFTDFWNRYPRKEGKKKAEQAWKKLNKSKKQKAIEDVLNRFKNVDRQFIPLPASYINGERWEDEQQTKRKRGFVC